MTKKSLGVILLALLLSFSLVACVNEQATSEVPSATDIPTNSTNGKTDELAPNESSEQVPSQTPSETVDSAAAENEAKYLEALEELENKNYVEARALFKEIETYKDSKQYLEKFFFVPISANHSLRDDGCDSFYSATVTLGMDGLVEKITVIGENGEKIFYDYSYDANSNCVEKVGTDLDGEKDIYVYFYDADDNLIKHVCTYASGSKEIYDYTYDTNGNLIQKVYTGSDDAKSIYDYTYDENGNLIEIVRSVFLSSWWLYNVVDNYVYDANGNLVERVETDSSGNKDVHDYTYDTDGNLVKHIYTWGGDRKEIYDYTYDANGNLIEESYVRDTGETDASTTDWRYKLIYMQSGTAEMIDNLRSEILSIFDKFDY